MVSGATISSTAQNNTLSDISTEITDSLSRSGKGPMLAPMEATDGTAAAPSITFDTDVDTGFYKAAANELGVAAAGVSVAKVTASGIVMTGSNPASTTGFTETLTSMNICKAWGFVSTDGAGAVSVTAGFNIASVSHPGDSSVLVTIADDMASANYCVVGNVRCQVAITGAVYMNSNAAGSFRLYARNAAGTINLATDPSALWFVVYGAQ